MNPAFAHDVATIAKIDAVRQILEVVCKTTGLGFSAVARVTDTNWVACAVRDEINFGLMPGGELKLETTICHEIRESKHLVAIDHVAQDAIFRDHPTPAMYGFQSYISVPITLPDGRFFGTLCAIDPQPFPVNTPAVIGMFTLFADLIAQHIDSQERMSASEKALEQAIETAKLRDHFIAVLGHDLRNPLGAINAGVEVLRSTPEGEDTTPILDILHRGSKRMAELINNLLDLARGRLGEGLGLALVPDANLQKALEQVVAELQSSSPSRTIESYFTIDREVRCDSARLAQMLSNLLGNAISHGDHSMPIQVKAQTSESQFEMSVTNGGKGIDPTVMAQLFEPFSRGSKPGQEGLGLGLYISAEIARAHGGTLEVSSCNGQTCFSFKMPI